MFHRGIERSLKKKILTVTVSLTIIININIVFVVIVIVVIIIIAVVSSVLLHCDNRCPYDFQSVTHTPIT